MSLQSSFFFCLCVFGSVRSSVARGETVNQVAVSGRSEATSGRMKDDGIDASFSQMPIENASQQKWGNVVFVLLQARLHLWNCKFC